MPRTTKKKLSPFASREQAEAELGRFAALEAHSNELKSRMDQEVTALKSAYEKELSDLGAEMDQAFRNLEAWADENPEEFARRKHVEFIHGSVGFRTGQPKIKKRRGTTSLGAIAKKLQTLGGALAKYVIMPDPKLDSKAIIRDRHELTKDELSTIGIDVVQEESFFVETKNETLTNGAKS